jgi:hypothetical protein
MRDEISTTYTPASRKQISRTLADLLMGLQEEARLGDVISRADLNPEQQSQLIDEIVSLSSEGLVVMRPPST